MSRIIFSCLIIMFAILEATVLPFPFVFLFSTIYFLFYEDLVSFATILIACVLLDTLFLNPLGFTSIFLFSFFIFLIILQKIFTLQTSILFTSMVLVIGVEVYRFYAHYPFMW